MSTELWMCSRRACKWIGTDEQKRGVVLPPAQHHGLRVTELRCPKCGRASFYKAKPGAVASDQPGKTPIRPGNTRALYWKDAAIELPDADLTVLICTPEGDEPVFLGYLDGVDWRNIHNEVVTVTHWADLPEAPVKE